MRGAKEAIGYDCEGLQSGEYGCAVHTCGACALSVMSEEEVSRMKLDEVVLYAHCMSGRLR